MPQNFETSFKPGDSAELRDDKKIDGERETGGVIMRGVSYRVILVEPREGDAVEDTVWLGPEDVSAVDIEEFDPKVNPSSLQDKRYQDVAPVRASLLKRTKK